MKRIVCIVCPNGCHLEVNEETKEVKGNRCPRGVKYALEELVAPKRSLTSSVHSLVPGFPVASVRTDGEIPKEKVGEAMEEINAYVLRRKVPVGSVLIEGIAGTDVPLILTADLA